MERWRLSPRGPAEGVHPSFSYLPIPPRHTSTITLPSWCFKRGGCCSPSLFLSIHSLFLPPFVVWEFVPGLFTPSANHRGWLLLYYSNDSSLFSSFVLFSASQVRGFAVFTCFVLHLYYFKVNIFEFWIFYKLKAVVVHSFCLQHVHLYRYKSRLHHNSNATISYWNAAEETVNTSNSGGRSPWISFTQEK